MKLLKYLIFSFLFISCSKDFYFSKDQKKIATQLKSIKSLDQSVRENETLIFQKYKFRTPNTVLDSLDHSPNPESHDIDLSKIPRVSIQINKLKPEIRALYDKDIEDSKKKLLDADNTNIESLYNIVKKYGYPSYYNRKWKDTINDRIGIAFVLTHTDLTLPIQKKLLKLMIYEFESGRVEKGEMKQYLWSLDGRIGFPYDYILEMEKWKKRANDL